MALYAIGDLHLSLGCDKPMDVFGGGWTNYVDKLLQGFSALSEDDVCVLCGDISWGISLDESLADFKFIENLPGKKIILKGNHDYWWSTVSKINSFFTGNNISSISILHNNCYFYEDTAICGTRGWLKDDTMTAEENAKIMAREAGRLRASLQAANTGAGKTDSTAIRKLCFFHYPPRFGNNVNHSFVSVMNEFGVKCCRYGHLHGAGHHQAVRGIIDDIEYDIISADYLNFKPQKIIL